MKNARLYDLISYNNCTIKTLKSYVGPKSTNAWHACRPSGCCCVPSQFRRHFTFRLQSGLMTIEYLKVHCALRVPWLKFKFSNREKFILLYWSILFDQCRSNTRNLLPESAWKKIRRKWHNSAGQISQRIWSPILCSFCHLTGVFGL